MPALDESLRLARLFARTDARRPASWLMLLAAAVVAADVSSAGVTSGMVAFGAGAMLAVGAIGNLPLRACAALGRASRAPRIWLVERATWPVVGLVAGAAIASPCPGPQAGAAATGLAAAAATVFAVRRRGVAAADAASLTLVIAGIAGAAGAIGAAQIGLFQIGPFDVVPAWGVAVAIAVVAWLLAGFVAAVIDWRRRAAAAWLHDAGPPRMLRRWLTGVAMASALAAMTGWLFLDPSRAWLLPLLSVGWFVALAVPEAALGEGASDLGGRRRSRLRQSLAAIVTPAAILGWPAVVAAALGAGGADGVRAAAVTVVVLAVAAATLAVIVWSLAARGATAETAQAVGLSVALAAALAWLGGLGLVAIRPSGAAVGPQTPGIAAGAAAQ
jgi:hypothetical protein